MLLVVLLTLAAPVARPPGQAGPACEPGQSPTFRGDFTALKAALGAAMGEPLDCERTGPEPARSIQPTTTGLAYRRADVPGPAFTTGQDHWALTPDGLAHWTGWHATGDPSGAADVRPAESAGPPTAQPASAASVEGVTIVREPDVTGDALIVDRQGTLYRIETGSGCLSPRPTAGQVVFVVSTGAFAGAGSQLIVSARGPECPILDSRPY